MDRVILNAIMDGTPGVTISVNAADLKEVVNGMMREERIRTEQAIEAHREKPTISRKEAAKMLGVGFSTLWNWSKSGYLIPVKIGTKVLYRYSDIEKMLTIKS